MEVCCTLLAILCKVSQRPASPLVLTSSHWPLFPCTCLIPTLTTAQSTPVLFLPVNFLEKIVDKYGENKQYVVQCQLCEGEKTNAATKMCEQCEVFYCDRCLENCHPSRGPLAKHQLVSPSDGKALLRSKHKDIQTKCSEHTDKNLSMFCVLCKTIVCYVCVQDGRHINHEVQAIGVMCKSQKTSAQPNTSKVAPAKALQVPDSSSQPSHAQLSPAQPM